MGMPSERLLSIGEISRLSRLSVRMLRYYDEHDVLRPTRTDPTTGHRSYSRAQLTTARWVRELRDVGMGVAEIAACIPLLEDPPALRAALEEQRRRLVRDAAGVLDRVREVDHLITALEGPAMSTTVVERTLPARTVAALRATIPTYADEGLLWQRLMAGLRGTGAVPAPDARSVAVFHDEEYVEHDPDVEVQLDVVGPFASTPTVHCAEVPEQRVAVGTLTGPYEGVGAVMAALGSWVAERGLRIAGPMFNVYVVSPGTDPDPAHWVTEVCVPVADAG